MAISIDMRITEDRYKFNVVTPLHSEEKRDAKHKNTKTGDVSRQDAEVSISRTGQVKADNAKNRENTVTVQEKSASEMDAIPDSIREQWENNRVRESGAVFSAGPGQEEYHYLEDMRMSEPKNYAKWYRLKNEVEKKGGLGTAEGEQLYKEVMDLENDFINRTYGGGSNNAEASTRAMTINSAISELGRRYSDGNHNTSVNFYVNDPDDPLSSMWRSNTKFNIVMSLDQLNSVAMGDNSEKENILKIIDESAENLKNAERDYSGGKSFLRFGIRLENDNTVTYHANYKGCEDSEGISSDTAEGLLRKLMEDE